MTDFQRQCQWREAIFVFSAKIGRKGAKNVVFCILFRPMRQAIVPPFPQATLLLKALMNVSINGPPQLTDENAKAVAEKLQNTNKRRQVTERALEMFEFEHLANGDETDDNGPMKLVPLKFKFKFVC